MKKQKEIRKYLFDIEEKAIKETNRKDLFNLRFYEGQVNALRFVLEEKKHE